ncbi:hypothetical protein ANCCAN_20619 [Ancylostoma caninum]|uniref:ATP-dependent DNA helicase n=1 Tax=Ancylostoma caninum TaxID=29170 RepID=A0A368FMU3_ANCCA|nr:hypothetical protein ANCCAN_20619 [Ancylostoma caninum]
MFYMIRPLNNLLACAGVVLNLKTFDGATGQRPLVLQGKFDVCLCHLNPDSGHAAFAQLFIADDNKVKSSVEKVMHTWTTTIGFDLIEKLMKVLRENNDIVKSYVTMYEIYKKELEKHKLLGKKEHPKVLMNLKNRREVLLPIASDVHDGCLNVPEFNNQIAAIYVCEDGVMPTHEQLNEGLRVMSRGGRTFVPHHSYNIDALTYPLLFPRGEQTYVRELLPKRTICDTTVAGLKEEETVDDGRDDECLSIYSEDRRSDDVSERNSVIGDCGKQNPRKFISRREFVTYILARRGNISRHRILGTGKLCAQFILHCYSRIEADRLAAIGKHKTEMRSTTASSLFRYLDEKLDRKGVKLGKLIKMPQRFVGSRAWYSQLYGNAMAVALRVGKPDLFITFTGNQDWPEIKSNLPGKLDTWITDPALCVRAFRLRLSQFMQEIKSKHIFGEVEAIQCSVEFQKRGMPHAHILVTLKEKLNTPEKIDMFISAEIPEYPSASDPLREKKLRLFNLVKKFMIHGPCEQRPDLACRVADPTKCDKKYPKSFREETELTDSGYPLYRRRNNGMTIPVGKRQITVADNRHVVPTNWYCLMRYECHINVEACYTLQSYKYIYKYIYKGPDQVLCELLSDERSLEKKLYHDKSGNKVIDIDMREVYLQLRYISHVEAAYRTFEFPMQYSSHTVISLSAHLPGEEPVYFRKHPNRASLRSSQLMAYFELVSHDDYAKKLTWVEVAEQYRFDKKSGTYVRYKRQDNRRIARIWSVSPKLRELYAVRKLLLYRTGVSSFEDLRTYNGQTYETFMDAAKARGYIEAENEWQQCLADACRVEMPPTIRRLFAHIVLYCRPPNTEELWNMFKSEMRSTRKSQKMSTTEQDMLSLNHIIKILKANGMNIEECGLETVIKELQKCEIDEACMNKFDEGYNEKADDVIEASPSEHSLSSLNEKQTAVIQAILDAARKPKTSGNRLFFIYGKAGCGKTYTFNTLIKLLEKQNKSVLCVASTGIAATLMIRGRTAHSTFCLPIKNLSSTSVARVEASSPLGTTLREVDLIIWDEVSMQNKYAIECVDRLLRDMAAPSNAAHPFGGVIIVLGGDWCQFLPVVPGGSPQDIMDVTLKKSYLWKKFEKFVLDENMRLQSGEEKHAEWLREVGEGKNFMEDGIHIKLPSSICMPNEKNVIDWLFSPDVVTNSEKLGGMAMLTVRNNDAIELNDLILEKLPGETVYLFGVDTPASEDEGSIGMPCDDEEYLHKLTPSGMPRYKIPMKKGAIIMLLRNIDVSASLCNGTRLKVISIMCDQKLLYCKNLLNGKTTFITRMPLDYEDENSGLAFRRFQFPVRLSFCMTINKSQGQTFEKVGVILRTPSFAHGSTYVALSRVRSKENIRVTANWGETMPAVLKIKNVVYQDILDDN